MTCKNTAAETQEHEIGGVNYIVARKFKENTTEDAASKMVRIIRAETLRLMGEPRLLTAKSIQYKKGTNKGEFKFL